MGLHACRALQFEEVGLADPGQRATVRQFHRGSGRKVGGNNRAPGPGVRTEHRMRVMVTPGGNANLFG